jgi:hypothetical protein
MSARSLLYKREISWEDVQHFLALREPEREWLEYKRDLSNQVVRSIAAMANTGGGLILIGVEEEREEERERERERGGRPSRPGRVIGVGPDDETRLVHKCRDLLDPPYIPEIWRVEIPPEAPRGEGGSEAEPRCLLIVRVDPNRVPARPLIYIEGRTARVPVRRGHTTQDADPRTLRSLFAEAVAPRPSLPVGPIPLAWTPDALRSAIEPFLKRHGPQEWVAFRLGYEEQRPAGGTVRPWTTAEREEIRDWLNRSPLRWWINAVLQNPPGGGIGSIDDLFETSRFRRLPEFEIVESRSGSIVFEPQWPDEKIPVWMRVNVERSGRISLDLVFSARLTWNTVFLLMGAVLFTMSRPELIERCFPEPGGLPRLRGCLIGQPSLDQAMIFHLPWPRRGGLQLGEAYLDEPWEGDGLREIEDVLRRFWAQFLSDLGYLNFEKELKDMKLPHLLENAS